MAETPEDFALIVLRAFEWFADRWRDELKCAAGDVTRKAYHAGLLTGVRGIGDWIAAAEAPEFFGRDASWDERNEWLFGRISESSGVLRSRNPSINWSAEQCFVVADPCAHACKWLAERVRANLEKKPARSPVSQWNITNVVVALPEMDTESCHSASRPTVAGLAERRAELVSEAREVSKSDADEFVPTPLQSEILKALAGKALKKEKLAVVVCGGDGSRLYKNGGLNELRDVGRVKHKNGLGYYRPDAPPPCT